MQQQRPTRDLASLDTLPTGRSAIIHSLQAPGGQPEWAQQLQDLGFVAGERVSVLTRGVPGGDPLVVRVGLSTYALRKAEAGCVQIDTLMPEQHAAQHQPGGKAVGHG